MAFKLVLPQVGMGMQDGTITEWLKQEGDAVAKGEIVCEVESAKSVVEIESPVAGTIAKLIVEEGVLVDVQEVIAIIDQEGGDVSPDEPPVEDNKPETKLTQKSQDNSGGERVQIEPQARWEAKQKNIDLTLVNGSGPGGRITWEDVLAYSKKPSQQDSPTGSGSEVEEDILPLTPMRRAIAERVSLAKQMVPHFYLKVTCAVDELNKLREEINHRDSKASITLNDIIVKAFAEALSKTPEANVTWHERGIRRFKQADLAVAVAIQDGLLTPVVENVSGKSLEQLSIEIRDIVKRARTGKIKQNEMQGGSAGISNLGMFGVEEFTAIINPPQSLMLAVGAAHPIPVVENGILREKMMMSLQLSVDHRVIDGVVAAALLNELKALLARPRMLL
ncbi:dihydrolipoamide acetyltransferase family protein [Kineobactrum salinum]|uniref:Dihydrolipoamide acetyltransferase component of pyruvate dehydrogenase complex n=1 Tax=Kineobactrum salinum TaxID=2708301 RepID=A0A6C0U807_9GAMM|nr:dihydrolipoamide acetyltransferase family protein [Kineobactrum salinum]QIB65624.1 2-oxo acid dehydrogenase subunit E2 [Kineobactrum salinum]